MKTILLVDDESDILDILVDRLNDLGMCLRASNGKEALAMVRNYRPDLIVSDYRMPDVSGLDLMKTMREQGYKIPVIWISGMADPEIFQEAWRLGVFEFYQKPLNIHLLRESAKLALDMGSDHAVARRPLAATGPLLTKVEVELPNTLMSKAQEHCRRHSITLNSYVAHILAQNLDE